MAKTTINHIIMLALCVLLAALTLSAPALAAVNRNIGWQDKVEILDWFGEGESVLPKDDYGTFRYAHHYTWDISAVDGLAFAHNFEFLPQVDDWSGNYLIDTDAGITYAFRANWQLIAKVEWDYKKKVGYGVKHSDIRYILGLGYKW